MDYDIPSLNFYLDTVAERFEEDSIEVENFCVILEALIFGGKFDISWEIDPDVTTSEKSQWIFDVVPPEFPEDSIRFFVAVADPATTERLWADPYYLDITTWMDNTVLDELGIKYKFEQIDDGVNQPYDVRIVETHMGLYSDPCRPATWLISPEYLGKDIDTITVKEVTLEILEKWKKYLVSNPDSLKTIKKKNPFRLASLDGKLLKDK